MSQVDAFLAEIRMFSFAFAPKGWALANGQTLPINQNQALFSLLGTTYGGNGQTTFQLPDVRGRTPMHVGNGHILGERAGAEAVTITAQTMPTHTHFVNASGANADNINPGSNRFAAFNAGYAPPNNLVAIIPTTVTNTGGSQAHTNMSPYGVISFGICLTGIFPSPN
jgi:microcystin-dependent protein